MYIGGKEETSEIQSYLLQISSTTQSIKFFPCFRYTDPIMERFICICNKYF